MQNISAVFLRQGTLNVMGFEALTVSSLSKALTASVYITSITAGAQPEQKDQALNRKVAQLAFITVEAQSVRVRFDGTAPTASVGHLFAAGDTITLCDQVEIANFHAIAVSADATLHVTYYGD